MYMSSLSCPPPQPRLPSTPEDRRPSSSPGNPTCPSTQPSAPPLSQPRPDSTYIGLVRNQTNNGRNHDHEHKVDTCGPGRPPEVLVSVGLQVCATLALARSPSIFNSFPQPRSQCRRVSVVDRALVRFFGRWRGGTYWLAGQSPGPRPCLFRELSVTNLHLRHRHRHRHRHHGGARNRASARRKGGGIRTNMLEAGHHEYRSDRCDGLRSGGFWVWAQLTSSSSSSLGGASTGGAVEVAGLGAWSLGLEITCTTGSRFGFLRLAWPRLGMRSEPMRQM